MQQDNQSQCPAASLIRGVELLQEKWVLLIVDSLLKGPTGFNDLFRRAEAVNATTLSQRLALMEKERLVVKTVHSTMPPRTSYELTDAGRALGPVLEMIRTWSEQYLDQAREPLKCPEAE